MNWYALHLRSNFERKVEDLLERQGVEPFAPFERIRRGPHLTVERPLFPGYVFGRFEIEQQRIAVLRTPGVIRIVGIGIEPVPVPDQEVAAVRQVLEAGVLVKTCAFVEAGDYVRVRCGPLAGVEGYVAFNRDSARVVVSIEMLHRSVSAEVETTWLELIRKAPPAVPAGQPSRCWSKKRARSA